MHYRTLPQPQYQFGFPIHGISIDYPHVWIIGGAIVSAICRQNRRVTRARFLHDIVPARFPRSRTRTRLPSGAHKGRSRVDGPHHDDPKQRAKDEETRAALQDRGCRVVAVRHDGDFAEAVERIGG